MNMVLDQLLVCKRIAMALAVTHKHSEVVGGREMRAAGKSNQVLFDLRYVSGATKSDVRL